MRLFTPDARMFQVIFQSIFLVYGTIYLEWSQRSWLYAIYIAAAIMTQLICESWARRHVAKPWELKWWKLVRPGLPSALITAMGLCLFLQTNHEGIAIAAAMLGIGAKYFLKVKGKHIFNPSALGIVAAVWLTGEAWVNPGQWGNGFVQFSGALILGIIVVTKVQKLDISLAFLFTYITASFIRQVLYLHWPADFFYQSVSTGTLLVFSFFMISDPKTTPDHPVARMVWGVMVGLLAFWLHSFEYVNGAPVLALVLLQPLVPLFDKIFSSTRFQWNTLPATHSHAHIHH